MKSTIPTRIDCSSIKELTSNDDKIIFLLKYAVLAPSTHNTQPWKFRIGDNKCEIHIDKSRRLPEADAEYRDMYISIGALIANLEIAAKAYGVYQKTIVASQKEELVATVYFTKDLVLRDTGDNKLLEAIETRCNYRGPFESILINEDTKKHLHDLCDKDLTLSLITDQKIIYGLAELTAEGLRAAYKNPRFRKEIGKLITSNITHKKKGIPGYALRMSLLQSIILPQLMKIKDIGQKLAGLNYKSFTSSTGVVVISCEPKKTKWVSIGRSMQRIILYLESLGISSSIYVAATENRVLNSKVKKMLNIKGSRQPQFLFCIGKPVLPKVYSPREDAKTKLI
jgi:hypothetical protein